PLRRLAYASQHALRACKDGYAGFLHCRPGLFLLAHQANNVGRRADEFDVAGFADFGKVRVFGKQPVAGMNGVHVGYFGGADYSRNIEITLRKLRWADAYCFISKSNGERIAIRLAVNGDRLDAQLLAGADHP